MQESRPLDQEPPDPGGTMMDLRSAVDLGFWNNIPREERREPLQMLPVLKRPTGKKAEPDPRTDAPMAEMGLMLFLTMMAIILERVAVLWITAYR